MTSLPAVGRWIKYTIMDRKLQCKICKYEKVEAVGPFAASFGDYSYAEYGVVAVVVHQIGGEESILDENFFMMIDWRYIPDSQHQKKRAVSFCHLPSYAIWHLLQYLDTESIVALAGVNSTLRNQVKEKFNLSVSLPFSHNYSTKLLANPYSHNKPVLRMKISRLCPDFIRLDRSLHSTLPTSHQFLLLNVSTLTHLCLHLEQTEYSDIESYRVAFLAMLQSAGIFKHLAKFHLTIPRTFLLNLAPGNFGPQLLKDALAVEHLVVTVMKEQDVKYVTIREFRSVLENLISSVRSRSFVLNLDSFKQPSGGKTAKIFENDHIEEFKLIAPCQLQVKLRMRKLKQLSISTIDQQCPMQRSGHQVGKCVLNRVVVAQGCPSLQLFCGVGMQEFVEMEANQERWRQACEDREGDEGGDGRLWISELPDMDMRVQSWRDFSRCTISTAYLD